MVTAGVLKRKKAVKEKARKKRKQIMKQQGSKIENSMRLVCPILCNESVSKRLRTSLHV